MVNFPGGFPPRFPGGPPRPPGPPGPPGPPRPPGPPGPPGPPRPPGLPNWFPWNLNTPGQGLPSNNFPGGAGNPPPPTPQLINQFQLLSQNPAQAQNILQSQGGISTFAAGCNGRWTIILLRNGQLFLMYVISSNVVGNTVGIIWPNFTFGSFPSSSIAAYSCY